jgi:hypothetical protein
MSQKREAPKIFDIVFYRKFIKYPGRTLQPPAFPIIRKNLSGKPDARDLFQMLK